MFTANFCSNWSFLQHELYVSTDWIVKEIIKKKVWHTNQTRTRSTQNEVVRSSFDNRKFVYCCNQLYTFKSLSKCVTIRLCQQSYQSDFVKKSYLLKNVVSFLAKIVVKCLPFQMIFWCTKTLTIISFRIFILKAEGFR